MKESITKFDLEAAFKALDELEVPAAKEGVKANKPALTEIFSRKSKFDTLFEEYYDIGTTDGLDDAKEAREAEIAKAKLARIEKIVDLDADSPEDLLTSYVGKYIMQCPQCMTLFYKNKEDVVESEDDPTIVNVNEVCQHCGNESGYTLIGKVGEAEVDETKIGETDDELVLDEPAEDETEENGEEFSTEENIEDSEEDFNLDELDLTIEDDEEEKQEESLFGEHSGDTLTEELLTEDTELEVSDSEFKELISSPEFKKPVSHAAAKAMLDKMSDESVDEALEPNAFYDEEDKIPAEDLTVNNEVLEEGGLGTLGKAIGKKFGQGIKNIKNAVATAIDNYADSAKTREEKADFIRENAMEDYDAVKIDTSGKLIPDEKNQRFSAFMVIGFTEKYSNGKLITMAPSFNNKDLVLGKNGKQAKKNYKDADNIAKGWSTQPGNGPAFIYLVKDENGTDAVFLCEYFKGELENDQLEKYFEVVKKAMKGAKLMANGGMTQTSEEDSQPEETASNEAAPTEGLNSLMSGVEELQEATLEKLISDSLVESYGNVAGFRLTECTYLNEKLSVNGKVFFTSGNTRNISYTFNEAYTNEEGKVVLHGLNEKLGLDKQFVLTGDTKTVNKTFIAESFNFTRK